MKQILLIISMYWCLPCFSMQELSYSLDTHANDLNLPSVSSVNAQAKRIKMRTTKSELIAGHRATPARVKAACKKVLPLCIVPIPLSLASIPVALLYDPVYAPWIMNGASLIWAGIWIASQYKIFRDDRAQFMKLLEEAPDSNDDLTGIQDSHVDLEDGSAQQTEVECLLRDES